MRDFLKHNVAGLLVLALGLSFLLFGIQRGEHKIVEQKATVTCLECIGIG